MRQREDFEAMARRLSLHAAEELHVTQPAVQVKTLEEGLPLLEQFGKKIRLTLAGVEIVASSVRRRRA